MPHVQNEMWQRSAMKSPLVILAKTVVFRVAGADVALWRSVFDARDTSSHSHCSERSGGPVLHRMLAIATQPWRLPAPPGRPWALFTKLQLIAALGYGDLSVFVGHVAIFIDRRRYSYYGFSTSS